MKITLDGRPITKKNHQEIRRNRRTGKPYVGQSERYLQYESDCGIMLMQQRVTNRDISTAVNVKCLYYMPDFKRVDLCNLLAATCDILVKYNVLQDDNCKIVVSHDGSRALYDKDNPRVEIEITEAT